MLMMSLADEAQREKYKKFILDIIRLYRSLPALWDVKSKEYRDRKLKNESYEIMVRKFREVYPDADRETVKKKFNILRTNYRKELKKVQANGETSLWYFPEFSFLSKIVHMDTDLPMKSEDYRPEHSVGFAPSITSSMEDSFQSAFKEEESDNNDEYPSCSGSILPEPSRVDYQSGEFQAVGYNVAAKLQKMDRKQQIYAEFLISKILTRGLLGTLSNDTDLL